MRVESTSITVNMPVSIDGVRSNGEPTENRFSGQEISFALQELASLGMTLAIGTVSPTVSVVGGHT
jgi:hypothetical protein